MCTACVVVQQLLSAKRLVSVGLACLDLPLCLTLGRIHHCQTSTSQSKLITYNLLLTSQRLTNSLLLPYLDQQHQIMGATSLFSRAHPRASAPKKVRGFLALSGEIRNQISSYYFDSKHHCEVAAKECQFRRQKPRTVKLWSGIVSSSKRISAADTKALPESPTVIRFSRLMGKYNAVKGLQTNWLGSLYTLNLVCKQVYMETAVFLYHKTVFIFDASKRMMNFFSVVSTLRLESITKLRLHYDTYGHPERTEYLVWQDKHGESW
jgi:hypothetical protein